MPQPAARSAHRHFELYRRIVNPNVTPGDGLTPSFIAARSNPTAHADADYTTSIRRHELLRELARQTESIREEDASSQLVAGGGSQLTPE